MAKVTVKVVEVIEKADGERVQKLSYILGIDNGKGEEIISYSQLVTIRKPQPMRKMRSMMTYTSSEH